MKKIFGFSLIALLIVAASLPLTRELVAVGDIWRKTGAKPEIRIRGGHVRSLNLGFHFTRSGEKRITFLPESVGRLNELETLDVSGNKLKSLPDCVWTLKKTGNSGHRIRRPR